MPENHSAAYRHSDAVETSQVGDRVVLYLRPSGASLVLNPTGARVWELIAKATTAQEVTQQLTTKFSTCDPESVANDVQRYLSQLLKHEAIVASNPAGE